MLEVESTSQRGRLTATGSGRNANEAVAGAVSETFAMSLHHRLLNSYRRAACRLAAQYSILLSTHHNE